MTLCFNIEKRERDREKNEHNLYVFTSYITSYDIWIVMGI